MTETLENQYQPIIRRFLPDKTDKLEEIIFEVERFLAENDYQDVSDLRFKEGGNVLSETLYDIVRLENTRKLQEDDLYLPISGAEIYFGFNYRKK